MASPQMIAAAQVVIESGGNIGDALDAAITAHVAAQGNGVLIDVVYDLHNSTPLGMRDNLLRFFAVEAL